MLIRCTLILGVYLFLGACGGGASNPNEDAQLSPVSAQLTLIGVPARAINSQEFYRFIPQIGRNTSQQTGRFSIIGKPSWASFNPNTGELKGTPSIGDAGRYGNIVISYEAGSVTSSVGPFDIIVHNRHYIELSRHQYQALVNQSLNIHIDKLVQEALRYELLNAPSWLSIDSNSGMISGTPPLAETGWHQGIIVHAYKNDALVDESDAISIQVHASNQPPSATSGAVALAYRDEMYFPAQISDQEQSLAQLEVIIEQQAHYGSIRYQQGQFIYQANSLSALSQGDQFTYRVYDGLASSSIATIDINILAAQDTVSAVLTPSHQSKRISQQALITVNSKQPLYLAGFMVQTDDGVCQGHLQLSLNNFQSCIGLKEVSFHNLNQTITARPKNILALNQEYQVRLGNIDNYWQQQTLPKLEGHFKTEPLNQIIISEVMPYFYQGTGWIELYNPSSNTINLDTFSLRSLAKTPDGHIQNHLFDLPPYNLEPGQYVLIHNQDPQRFFVQQAGVIFIGNYYKQWYSHRHFGYFELIEHNDGNLRSHDYMVFGQSENNIAHHTLWDGAAVSGSADSLQSSFIRSDLQLDSNQASDWHKAAFNSPGGANDIHCTEDNDQDGIPDCSEMPGSTYAGLPLYDWGARLNQKDIFIEIDHMDPYRNGTSSKDIAMLPSRKALNKVVAAFARQGIVLHFDVGDLFDQNPGLNPENMDLGGGQKVPHSKGIGFSLQSHSDFYLYKRQYQGFNRSQIFHYLLLADTQSTENKPGSSGIAELPGNDMIVTLGHWGFSDSSEQQSNYYANIQAATIMHELGHNLGLKHGGHDDVNHKPNYLSVMNYLYAMVGLPDTESSPGDRYLRSQVYRGRNNCHYSGLQNSPYSSDFIIDYSAGERLQINESSIHELTGQIGTNTFVDFNCNGVQDKLTPYSEDLNHDKKISVLYDHNDWQSIKLGFSSLHDTNVRRFKLPNVIERVSKQTNDRQHYVVEPH